MNEQAFIRFNNEYLLQQGIEGLTEKNRLEHGLDEDRSEFIGETEEFWLIRHRDGNDVINIVYKDENRRMEGFEL